MNTHSVDTWGFEVGAWEMTIKASSTLQGCVGGGCHPTRKIMSSGQKMSTASSHLFPTWFFWCDSFRRQEAFVQQRDERAAEELKKELKRLFELDRQHRLRNGAAETNLAALRERVSQREKHRRTAER